MKESEITELTSELSKDYDLPADKFTPLINDVANFIEDLQQRLKLDYEIDYNLLKSGKAAKLEKRRIKIIAKSVLWYINEYWLLNDFKKYTIAGRILQFYRLDKYNRIKTQSEFDADPTNAQDFKHYLFDVMKSRFKTFTRDKQ